MKKGHYFENHRLVKININYNKDPYFIHRSIIDIILSCFSNENKQIKPYLNYFLLNSIVVCELKVEFEFFFQLSLYILRNFSQIKTIQTKHNTTNSCYQNYFKEDLGDLMLKMLRIYEEELRNCQKIEILKEAAKSSP